MALIEDIEIGGMTAKIMVDGMGAKAQLCLTAEQIIMAGIELPKLIEYFLQIHERRAFVLGAKYFYGICVYCGEKWGDQLDHVIPRCQGGSNENDNLTPCCNECNMKKSGKTPEQANMPILYNYKTGELRNG